MQPRRAYAMRWQLLAIVAAVVDAFSVCSAEAATDSASPPDSRPAGNPESLLSGLSADGASRRDVWFLVVSAGPALSGALAPTPATGVGAEAAVEYGAYLLDWFSPRAYGGMLLTFPMATSCGDKTPCEASAKIGFAGVKGRITFLPPHFSVLADFGVGTSFGEMSTQTPEVSESLAGLTYHLPFALGIAWGDRPRLELALTCLIHPVQKQLNTGLTFSMGFWL